MPYRKDEIVVGVLLMRGPRGRLFAFDGSSPPVVRVTRRDGLVLDVEPVDADTACEMMNVRSEYERTNFWSRTPEGSA